MGTVVAAFFDLGKTLGNPKFSDSSPPHLAGLEVFPLALTALQSLKVKGLQLGIISNTGADKGPIVDLALRSAWILKYFDDGLRIYSADVNLIKPDPEIFREAIRRAGLADAPGRCLFIANEEEDRIVAKEEIGMQTCPEPTSPQGADCLKVVLGAA